MDGKRWHTREDSGIRLDAQGRFWHDGVLVENANVARAFHRGLVKDGERYLIRFGPDWCVVQVDDAPFQVEGLALEGGRVLLRLDDETTEPLDPATLCLGDEALYARVRAGSCEARFSRAAQGQLAPWLEETASGVVLRLDGRVHPVAARGSGSGSGSAGR